jgi:hypothetical protein
MRHSISLFAQFNQFQVKGAPGGPPPEFPIAIIIGVIVAFVVIFLILEILWFFYARTMSNALKQVSEGSRAMQPGLPYLMMIPCFNIVWQFFIAIQVPASLQAEFRNRGMDDGSDYGKSMGLTAAIIWAVEVFMGCIPFVNYCAPFVAIAGVVFWIIFWVKIAGLSSKLASGGSSSYGGERKYDDDDNT